MVSTTVIDLARCTEKDIAGFLENLILSATVLFQCVGKQRQNWILIAFFPDAANRAWYRERKLRKSRNS